MYTAFYGLREKPFALLPDPRYLFLAESHREALAHLLYGIDQSEGFICITGEVGTGKTTICRTLLDRLGGETEVAFLFNPSQTGIELLQDIHAEFGLEALGRSRSELTAELNLFLLDKRRDKRRVLLIIDEAQNLNESTLEQVRLLSNLETESSKLIQILLLGQPELDRKLDSKDLRQLRQRISVRWQLHPLSAGETKAYVRHRLHVAAGAERDVFSDPALREIHRRTGGVPRLVNVLCDRALLAGYVARASRIGPAIVRQAAKEIPDARRRPLAAQSAPRAVQIAGRAARRLGAGVVFAAGVVLGLVLAAALLVGSLDGPEPRVRDWLASLGLAAGPQREAAVSASSSSDALGLDLGLLAEPTSSGPDAVETAFPASEEGAAATVFIGNPAAFETRSLASVQAGALGGQVDDDKVDEMSNAALEGLAEGDFLGAVLETEDEALVRRDALNAVLGAYGMASLPEAPATDELGLAWLAERGLGVLPVSDADLDVLLRLNHPALLRLHASGESGARLVALLRLRGDLAALYGVAGTGPLWVPVDELLQQWDGDAWVAWNDFEAFRPILAFGEQGHSVSWLQEALAELGYFEGEPTGLFDAATREGLRAFQREQRLLPDGMAGPRTRMVLYDRLDRYAVPRLTGGAEGEDAG